MTLVVIALNDFATAINRANIVKDFDLFHNLCLEHAKSSVRSLLWEFMNRVVIGYFLSAVLKSYA